MVHGVEKRKCRCGRINASIALFKGNPLYERKVIYPYIDRDRLSVLVCADLERICCGYRA